MQIVLNFLLRIALVQEKCSLERMKYKLCKRLTFSFISPRKKCEPFTINFKPNVDVSRPSRPLTMGSCSFSICFGAGSPFINQFKCVAGRDRPDVQLTFTVSPI